ncbi:MAG: ATP-binding cassette domain-containing protein, partial [Bacteroidales bacterium]|nr:ATP-binding cassette domain-containing protein [Bacteroidales bacterium]
MIKIDNLFHYYSQGKDNETIALDGVNLEINEGEFVVILGHNGCGKSTLAKHLNSLLLPGKGDVVIDGLDS